MHNVKRITIGLLGLVIAGMFTITCEKSNGPAPYVCEHIYNQLVLVGKDNQPVGPGIPLNAIRVLNIQDAGVQAVVNVADTLNVPMETLGKITFAP